MSTLSSSIASTVLSARNDHDHALKQGAKQAGVAAATVGSGCVGAMTAGAGALSGYAGMASAVSTMGLGAVTTMAAGALGSAATGAAATAMVTAALGGPVTAGVVLVAGTGALAYGVCRGIGAVCEWLFD